MQSKKQFMNIVPQEVTKNGKRSLRYKGSNGKFHDVAADGSTLLSAEELERIEFFSNGSIKKRRSLIYQNI